MTTPTPDELRQAAYIVGRLANWDLAAARLMAEAEKAEAAKTARRERLVEELAETMHQTDVAVGHRVRTWAESAEPIQDDFRRFARAVIDRFPSLLEADDE